MKEGYIKLHRGLVDWEWWDDHNTTRLWIYILVSANWKDKKWRGKVIKRGSFITSLDHLSKGSGLSLMQVRTSLKKLINTGEINKQTTNAFTLITVVSYDSYQDNNKPHNKRVTNEQQTNNKRITTTKEREEREEVKEGKEISKRFTPPGESEIQLFFQSKGLDQESSFDMAEAFWNFYESKNWYVGKNKMKNWKAAAAGWLNRNNGQTRKESNGGSVSEALRSQGY